MKLSYTLQQCTAAILLGIACFWPQNSEAITAEAARSHKALDLQQILSVLPGLDARFPVIRDSPGLLEEVTDFLEENASLPAEELEQALRKNLCEKGYKPFCCSSCYTSTTTAPVTTQPTTTRSGLSTTQPTATEEATTEEATTEEATTEEATTEEATTKEATTEEATTEEATTEEATTEEATTEEATTEEATTEEATTEGSTTRACTRKPEPPVENCTITISTSLECFASFLSRMLPFWDSSPVQAITNHLRGGRA